MRQSLLFLAALAAFWALPAFAAQTLETDGIPLGLLPLSQWGAAAEADRLQAVSGYIDATAHPDKPVREEKLKAASRAVADCVSSAAESGKFDNRFPAEEAIMECLWDARKEFPFLMSHPDLPREKPKPYDPQNGLKVVGQIRALLAEFDSFKDSPEFKKNVYSRDPGKAWIYNVKALGASIPPEMAMPRSLRTAPGNLWQLGMFHAYGRKAEEERLRKRIEKQLEEVLLRK